MEFRFRVTVALIVRFSGRVAMVPGDSHHIAINSLTGKFPRPNPIKIASYRIDAGVTAFKYDGSETIFRSATTAFVCFSK